MYVIDMLILLQSVCAELILNTYCLVLFQFSLVHEVEKDGNYQE